MSLYGYRFIKEVEKFNLDIYIPHLGWIGAKVKTLKIYTRDGSTSFFLHDETREKMYEFSAVDPKRLKDSEEYEKVIRAYLVAYPDK